MQPRMPRSPATIDDDGGGDDDDDDGDDDDGDAEAAAKVRKETLPILCRLYYVRPASPRTPRNQRIGIFFDRQSGPRTIGSSPVDEARTKISANLVVDSNTWPLGKKKCGDCSHQVFSQAA